MSIAHPQFLWLLLVLPPALVLFFWWAANNRARLMAQFIPPRLLPGLVSGVSPVRRKVRLGCIVGAVACLIFALAGPRWGFTWQEVKQRGVDVIVAIDTSKSMLAQDIAPNRLARAKLAALDLMQLAKADRLGLVAFAGTAFLQCPLTIDDTAFRQSVDALDVGTIPQGGTALAEAIRTAEAGFRNGDNHKVLVLITDGEDHDSGALEAAQKAAQAGLKIFTVGVGTAEGQILRVHNAQGQDDYVRDEQGNVVKSHLNQRLLEEIAGTSPGCFYLPLRGADTMATVYSQGIAPLPKAEHQELMVKQYQERYHWPLAAACVLLILEMLLPERKPQPRTQPAAAAPAARPVVSTAAALLALLLVPARGSASTGSALREYQAGNYSQALQQYEQLLKRKGDDPRLHFNAGAAAYRTGKFDEAANQFNQALASRDLKLQEMAFYNHGNALYRLGESQSDTAKRSENWQKAITDYELSLKLNPQDADAKYNAGFVKQRLEELKKQQQQQQQSKPQNIQPSEAARKAKAAADEAVRVNQFAQALSIMEQSLQQDSTTSYYNDYIQRLKEINGVQNPPAKP